MTKVFQIDYTSADSKNTKQKIILTSRTIKNTEDMIPVFEITDGIGPANGPDFPDRDAYNYMYRAAVAFAQHRRVLAKWKDSSATRDENYVAYVHHLMHKAPKSTQIIDLTRHEFREASVEFYPNIGFPGFWRTLRSDRIKIIKAYSFASIVNDSLSYDVV